MRVCTEVRRNLETIISVFVENACELVRTQDLLRRADVVVGDLVFEEIQQGVDGFGPIGPPSVGVTRAAAETRDKRRNIGRRQVLLRPSQDCLNALGVLSRFVSARKEIGGRIS
jgi:hypothetical protein